MKLSVKQNPSREAKETLAHGTQHDTMNNALVSVYTSKSLCDISFTLQALSSVNGMESREELWIQTVQEEEKPV